MNLHEIYSNLSFNKLLIGIIYLAIREPRQGQPPSRYYLPSEQRPTERPRPFQTNPTAAPTSPQVSQLIYLIFKVNARKQIKIILREF